MSTWIKNWKKWLLAALFAGQVSVAFAEIDFLSGLFPDRRPDVIKIKQVKKNIPLSKALHGVLGDIPENLIQATQSQGGWFTPLHTAGMTGVYDLRNYHNKTDQKLAETYSSKSWDPIHFKPQINNATDQQCLNCHKEVLDRKVLDQSQVGVKANEVLAWYQTLDTYSGPQADFHWRHLQSPYAQKVMQFKCNTCHQGNDPREEAMVPSMNPPPTAPGVTTGFTLRKGVNPQMCLMCHGQFPDPKIMNLPDKWSQIRDVFQNDCLSCHAVFRTERHKVNFLKPEAIETVAKETGGDVCYGCHGGRAWYRLSFLYPRHKYPGMPDEIPLWAKDRPTQSESRFLDATPLGAGDSKDKSNKDTKNQSDKEKK